jgi:hypothetical protein
MHTTEERRKRKRDSQASTRKHEGAIANKSE